MYKKHNIQKHTKTSKKAGSHDGKNRQSREGVGVEEVARGASPFSPTLHSTLMTIMVYIPPAPSVDHGTRAQRKPNRYVLLLLKKKICLNESYLYNRCFVVHLHLQRVKRCLHYLLLLLCDTPSPPLVRTHHHRRKH